MDKPEEKKPPQGGMNKPPVPPPSGKKPGGPVPKGPVPPRASAPIPRIPSPGAGAGGPPKPPMAGGRPPMPPMMKPPSSPGMPPLARPPASPSAMPTAGVPSFKPPMPPGPGAVPPLALPPAVERPLGEAESAKNDLEQKVADLEKKLLEEKEKVLLASLRGKEEEAVAAKVESSIKEIQDKLRREKREQEIEEARRKAEARLLDLERRIAEEREAWVATLKTQLNQRDQVGQEMEMHFSTRLKDLEYRWAQEKSALENAVRDKEGELTRIRHEFTLKGEHEKSFWEDRVKTISIERDKFDRELERLKDRAQQEKEQLHFERQSLRDQVQKLESSMRFLEEQARIEKAALHRDFEANLNLFKTQSSQEKEIFEKQKAALMEQMESLRRDVANRTKEKEDRDSHARELERALTEIRAKADAQNIEHEKILAELRSQVSDRGGNIDRQVQEARRADEERIKLAHERIAALKSELEATKRDSAGEVEEARAKLKKAHEQIDELTKSVTQARHLMQEQVARVQAEADNRVRTLQTRLDYYDANTKREYDLARDKVRVEMESLQKRVQDYERKEEELKTVELERAKKMEDLRARCEKAERERTQYQQGLDHLKKEWKDAQWELDSRIKELMDQVKMEQGKLQQALDEKLELEQELKQRAVGVEDEKAELVRLKEQSLHLEKKLVLEREQVNAWKEEVDSLKKFLHDRGGNTVQELRDELQKKTRELEKSREILQELKNADNELQGKEDILREKERVFRQLANDKDQTIDELKSRVHMMERKLQESNSERSELLGDMKREIEKAVRVKEEELEARLAGIHKTRKEEMNALERKHREELTAAVDEAERRLQADGGGHNPQIETQLRQQIEMEFMTRLRDQEAELEAKIAQLKEESKKELDRLHWENESMKEEMKRARDARAQVEREAQEILQQAEEHYKNELAKKLAEMEESASRSKGLFTSIGRFLDTPLIDTKKKKENKEPGES